MKQTSVDILDSADAFEDKLNWQLFKLEQEAVLYGGGMGEWQPGEPLYTKPLSTHYTNPITGREQYVAQAGHQYIRPMIQEMSLDDFHIESVGFFALNMRCVNCEVHWAGVEPCFVCGKDTSVNPTVRELLDSYVGFNREWPEIRVYERIAVSPWRGLVDVPPPPNSSAMRGLTVSESLIDEWSLIPALSYDEPREVRIAAENPSVHECEITDELPFRPRTDVEVIRYLVDVGENRLAECRRWDDHQVDAMAWAVNAYGDYSGFTRAERNL